MTYEQQTSTMPQAGSLLTMSLTGIGDAWSASLRLRVQSRGSGLRPGRLGCVVRLPAVALGHGSVGVVAHTLGHELLAHLARAVAGAFELVDVAGGVVGLDRGGHTDARRGRWDGAGRV